MIQFNHSIVKVKNVNGEYEGLPALKGESIYDIAVRHGYEGTEDEMIQEIMSDGWVTTCARLDSEKVDKTSGFGEYLSATKADDWNNVDKTVVRSFPNTAANKPVSRSTVGFQIANNPSYKSQLAFDWSKNDAYIRSCYNATWSSWDKLSKDGHTHPAPKVNELDEDWTLGCTVSGTLSSSSAASGISETKAITIPYVDGRPPDEIKLVVDCTITGNFTRYSSSRTIAFRIGSTDSPLYNCALSLSQSTENSPFDGTYTRNIVGSRIFAVTSDIFTDTKSSATTNYHRTWRYEPGRKYATNGDKKGSITISHTEGSGAVAHEQNLTVYALRSSDGGLASYSVNYTISIYVRNMP